jgi:Tfp pilus assembly protein PilF
MRRLALLLFLSVIFSRCLWAGEKPWIEVSSPHFRVLTNGSQNEARHVAREFEQMRYVFVEYEPQFRLEGGAPLTIFAAQDEDTAKMLEPSLWKGKGAKPAGVYHHAWERENVMVRLDDWNQGAHEVVYHEYVHSILHRNLHWIPIWLDEGMADFYGFTRFEGDKIYLGAPAPRYRLAGQFLIPIETLISVDYRSPYYRDEDKVYRFYAESWGLVHFLMFGPGMERGKKMNEYSALLQQGVESKKAFQQVFGDLKSVDSRLSAYLSRFSFQAAVLPSPPELDEKSFIVRALTLAETKAELAAFHLWTHDLEDARRLGEEAVKEDPKLGFAHEVMGFVDFGEGKDADAVYEFTQATNLTPNLPLSLFAKTMMSPTANSNDPADENSFHDGLIKVLDLNPQFAPAYIQLAKLDMRRGDPQSGLAVSRRAEQLEPTRAGYHILSGEILRRLGREKEAASFARFVAERWPGADHDEAVELWNALSEEYRAAGDPLKESALKDTLSIDGHVTAVKCGEKGVQPEFGITRDGKLFSFRAKRPFSAGFSDTIWYGEDHFNLCHHLEGMRAIIRYRPTPDSTYTGDIAEIEVRDELPAATKTAIVSGRLNSPQSFGFHSFDRNR